MSDTIKSLGISDALRMDKADFSQAVKQVKEKFWIDKVLHKTFISVDERGTKAGAITVMVAPTGLKPRDFVRVTLDRPFVYAIIDNATCLPIFIGTVMTIDP